HLAGYDHMRIEERDQAGADTRQRLGPWEHEGALRGRCQLKGEERDKDDAEDEQEPQPGRSRAPCCFSNGRRGGDYFVRPRIAAKPATARSAASMTSAHWDSVGVGFGMALAGVTGKKAQAAAEGTVIVFAPFVVTVPPNASALPFSCE